MITGTQAILSADDPDRARAFFDVLEWPNVDAHGGAPDRLRLRRLMVVA